MASNIAKWKSTGRDTRLSDHEDHCVGTATEREANVSCLRNRSALLRELLYNNSLYVEVSCKEDQIKSAKRE